MTPLAASPTPTLSNEQCARFWRDGFIALPVQVQQPLLGRLQHDYDRMLGRERDCGIQDRYLGGKLRQIVNVSTHYPDFVPPELEAHFRALSNQLLGGPTRRSFDMIMVKEPGESSETPWHQDWSYSAMPFAATGVPIPNRKLQYWLALDDVDVDNGCMQFLPGVHQGRLGEHYIAGGSADDEGRLLALRKCDARGAVACPLAAGACTIHVEGTPHFTGANRTTDRRRRAYIFNFETLKELACSGR